MGRVKYFFNMWTLKFSEKNHSYNKIGLGNLPYVVKLLENKNIRKMIMYVQAYFKNEVD